MTTKHLRRTVVVGVDGSDNALRAVRWGAAEATRRRIPLRLIIAFAGILEHLTTHPCPRARARHPADPRPPEQAPRAQMLVIADRGLNRTQGSSQHLSAEVWMGRAPDWASAATGGR
jgi:hypothetical protein